MAKEAKHSGDLLMLKQMRKSFKNIDSVKDVWIKNCNLAISSAKSLANVAEQYHCILRVSEAESKSLLVNIFPEVPERIQHKLMREMELLVQKLIKIVEEMQIIHSKVHQQYANAMAVYKKSSHRLPVQEVAVGTATWPSIASMLEWLLDLDCIFQNLYENQRQVLDSLDYSDEEQMQSLPARWKRGNREAQESIENVLAHVSFFMADG